MMNKMLDLIPYPHEVKIRKGYFSLGGRAAKIIFCGVAEADSARLLGAAERLGAIARVGAVAEADIVLEVSADLKFPALVRHELLEQGYILEVTGSKIRAQARSARGLYYALRTLGQLQREGKGVPVCTIKDWPDLPFRCLHIPGFGNIPRYDEMLNLIEMIADWKYTALMIEYDDRFTFERYPVLNHPAAFSKSNIRDIIDFAAERYIEVVPCLDSLGHANFYLMHKEFQHLAEIPGNICELCPSNPETLVFIKNLWREVLEVHRDCRFAAITGDEVFREGEFCPACNKYAKEGKLSLLYTNYYRDLGNWVLEHGVRPMIWADMIEIYPEEIDRLPRETVFGDWNYSGHRKGAGGLSLFLRGAGEFRQGEENQVPDRYARTFGRYLRSTDGTVPFEPFPYLRYFMDKGFDVMSSAMANVMKGAGFLGRIANNRHFCMASHKVNAFGHMNTTWEGYLPHRNSLSGIAAGGAYAWNSADVDEQNFFERFARRALGPDNQLPKVISVMERLTVEARGFDVVPKPGDQALLRDSAQALRAAAQPGDEGMYAEMMCLHVEMVRRLSAIQETAALCTRCKLGTGDDYPIDLTAVLNWNGVMPKRSGIFDVAPGRQIVHGIPFELPDYAGNGGRCGICVGGEKSLVGTDYGQAVSIAVGRKCDMLFFLVAGAWGAVDHKVGLLRMRMMDGCLEDLPLIVGCNLWNWSKTGNKLLDNGLLSWEGAKAIDGGDGYRFAMYLCWWQNPKPDSSIEKVEMLPLAEEAGFAMLFGLTARVAGTARPAPDIAKLKQRAKSLIEEMERMEQTDADLYERHKQVYRRCLAPEDVERQMGKLKLADLKESIAALRRYIG